MSEDSFRGTGRSNRQVLQAVLLASQHPGVWIKIEDHHRTQRAKEHTFYRAVDVLRCLNIDFDARSHSCEIQITGK